MPETPSPNSDLPQQSSPFWRAIGITATAFAAIGLITGSAWVALNAPTQVPAPAQEGATAMDQPCGYWLGFEGEPYPYYPEGKAMPDEPTHAVEVATWVAEAYPALNRIDEFDYSLNATQYALYGPTAQAHATRCVALPPAQRQTEYFQQDEYFATFAGRPTLVTTAEPVLTIVNTLMPTEPPSETATHTETPTTTATAESPTPSPIVVDDPVAAGLGYSFGGRFWRIGPDGVHDGTIGLTQATGGIDPSLQYELYLQDQDLWTRELRSGELKNLTASLSEWEDDFAWWPARPGTIAYVFRDLATPEDARSPLVPYLGTVNLDGSDRRRLVMLGDYYADSYSLGADGDSVAFLAGQELVRYRMSDGTRQAFSFDGLGLSPTCNSMFGPGLSADTLQIAARCIFAVGDDRHDVATLIVDLQTGSGHILDRHSVPPAGREWDTTPVAWSPDGRFVITAGEVEFDTPFRVVSIADGTLISVLPGRPVLFSPNGQWLLLRAVAADAPAPWFLVDTVTWAQLLPLAIPEEANHLIWS
jgi:hypothetical protein